MFMSDVMTTNVINIPSNTSLAEAKRIMDAHHIRRLPVVDRGMLVGVVTRDQLDKAGPSQISRLDIHEITRILNKVTVKEVMTKNPITVNPDATVEEAVKLAQEKKIGSLLVVDNGRVVGVATPTTLFFKKHNPHPGIRKTPLN